MNSSDAGKLGYEKTGHILREKAQEKSAEIRAEYEVNPKTCTHCDGVLSYEQRRNKFCSKSCSASYNNQGVARFKGKGGEPQPRRECKRCGKPVYKRSNEHCDDCIADSVYNRALSLSELNSDRHRKQFLLRTREHRCEVCNFNEWMGQTIPLDLDHIDGNPDNNTEENLRLICPNCHAQTNTYKGKGIIAGRNSKRKAMRRKRYAEGKSY
jgi:hypothetical protein